jgi:phosphatidylserine/phosphatidylglycerophosphate/cardiolipin synthase-like enzyme
VQAIESIHILKDAGVTVFECSDYRHRKVAVIDKRILWEGSLNIMSQAKSRELMRRIVSPPMAKQMFKVIRN